MRTSYSALETYLQCPQKYKFQELDRIKAPKSREAVFGTLIHDTLKFVFKRDPLFPTLDEVLSYFREHWMGQEPFSAPEEEKAYFEEGARMLKNFYVKNSPWNFIVVDLESHFAVELADEKSGQTHILAGKIDRIDKLPDENYEIIDYKTSKRMPSQDSLSNNLQLSLYALALQKRWPHLKPEATVLSLYFLKHGEKLSTKANPNITAKTQEKILSIIREVDGRLRENKIFEPLPGPLCDWCGYKPICPAWRHLYRDKNSASSSPEKMEADLSEFLKLKKHEQETKDKIDELQGKIRSYMEREGLTRLFGREGFVAKTMQQRREYHFDKIKAILEPLGKWGEILSADEKKFKEILKSLPLDIRQTIESEGVSTKAFALFKTSLKPLKAPDN